MPSLESLKGLTIEQMRELPGAVPFPGGVYLPPTPEERESYEEEVRTMHGGTYYVRHMQASGAISTEQADISIRHLRWRRKLERSRRRNNQ